jgi:hypothetical protein
VRAAARRPIRQREHGGQIRTGRQSGSIFASRAIPIERIRLWPSANCRVHQRERLGPAWDLERAMTRTSESGGQNRAIGAHFPEFAYSGAAVARAAGPAVAFQPCMPDDFKPGCDLEVVAPEIRFPVMGTMVLKLTSRSKTPGWSRSTRFAGLVSGSTQLSAST